MEERPTERERQRFSERPRERRQTAGENFCERAVSGKGVGGCGEEGAGVEVAWPEQSLIVTVGSPYPGKITRMNSNFIHCAQ